MSHAVADPVAVPTVSVVLAFPHARLRTALEALLAAEDGIAVVASVADAPDGGRALRRHHPDVLVADLSLVSMTGGLLERWGLVEAGVPVVVASFEAHAAIGARLRAHGAAAYVSKEHLADRLPHVLRDVTGSRPAAVVTA